MTEIEFWFEFASPYAYLSAARIDRLAAGAPLTIVWRPFLLGPIFARRPGHASPFQEPAPAEAAYRKRDVERCAARDGTPLRWPSTYPRGSLLAARVAHLGVAHGWCRAFARAIFQASFVDDRDIADPQVVGAVLAALGLPAADILARAVDPAHKAALAAAVDEAVGKGVFGAPSFIVAGELFWGNDRLEQAIEWGCAPARRVPA
ncbi:MAG: 2-hydroxychromene-2-carboxylate isomerase [Alphaproteobacteria bacterium]